METSPTESRRTWLLLPITIAVVLPLWQTQFRYGWLEMALGRFAWLFWIAAAAWVLLTFIGIRRHRAWWLLITAPLVLYPVLRAFGMLAACVTGDCL